MLAPPLAPKLGLADAPSVMLGAAASNADDAALSPAEDGTEPPADGTAPPPTDGIAPGAPDGIAPGEPAAPAEAVGIPEATETPPVIDPDGAIAAEEVDDGAPLVAAPAADDGATRAEVAPGECAVGAVAVAGFVVGGAGVWPGPGAAPPTLPLAIAAGCGVSASS